MACDFTAEYRGDTTMEVRIVEEVCRAGPNAGSLVPDGRDSAIWGFIRVIAYECGGTTDAATVTIPLSARCSMAAVVNGERP
jgi:hypothetical protein